MFNQIHQLLIIKNKLKFGYNLLGKYTNMRQLLSRNPSKKSIKYNKPQTIQQLSRQNMLKRPTNSRSSNNYQGYNQKEALSVKKRKFINLVSKQKDIQQRCNLNISTVSLPAQRIANSRITTIITPMILQNSNDNFLQRRSQSCASIGFSPSRHCVSTTMRPVPMIIRQRIVPVPMRFQYNSPSNSQVRPFSQTSFGNYNCHPSTQGIMTNNQNMSMKPMENHRHFRSAFQMIPSKQEILFDGTDSYNSIQNQKKTLVHSIPIYDLYTPQNKQKMNNFLNSNIGMPIAQKTSNTVFSGRSNVVQQCYRQPQNLTHHVKSPTFGENIVNVSAKVDSKVTQKINTHTNVSSNAIINDINGSFSDERNKYEARSTKVENNNARLINQIDQSMQRIDKSIDKIKEKTSSALKKSDKQNKQDVCSSQQDFNSTKKLDQITQKSDNQLKGCKSSQILKDLFESNQKSPRQETQYQTQQPRIDENRDLKHNKQQSVYQSRVSRSSQGSLYIKDQTENISFSRFKEFKEFQEYRQFKEKLVMLEKGRQKQSCKVESSRCQPACKHIRQLLQDYRQLRTLRQFNSVKGIKDRQSQKLKSSKKTPAKMFY